MSCIESCFIKQYYLEFHYLKDFSSFILAISLYIHSQRFLFFSHIPHTSFQFTLSIAFFKLLRHKYESWYWCWYWYERKLTIYQFSIKQYEDFSKNYFDISLTKFKIFNCLKKIQSEIMDSKSDFWWLFVDNIKV